MYGNHNITNNNNGNNNNVLNTLAIITFFIAIFNTILGLSNYSQNKEALKNQKILKQMEENK